MVTETTTATMTPPTAENIAEMDKLMSDGKRNYVCQQPHLALDSFVDLCEKLSKWYGQESEKCVDAYLLYGKTLLDVARLENGVLGHAIKEMPVFGSETEDPDTEKEGTNTEDEEDSALKLKPEEIREKVVDALRGDNLYYGEEESTEDEGTADEGEVVDGDETEEVTTTVQSDAAGAEKKTDPDAQEAEKGHAAETAEAGGANPKSDFDAGFSEGFGAGDVATSSDVVHDCTSNVRSVSGKRKSDDEMSDGCEKKVKNDQSESQVSSSS